MRDFTLPASSANARRLVEASKITNLELSPEIISLAEQGKIPQTEFERLLIKEPFQDLTQKLVDYNANAIVCFDDRDEQSIINSVVGAINLLALPAVISTRKRGWPKQDNIETIGLSTSREFFTKERRGGVLIHDQNIVDESYCREFQHIIILHGITMSKYRERYFTEKDFLRNAVTTLHGMSPFETISRRNERECYPYFNIIDLIKYHK